MTFVLHSLSTRRDRLFKRRLKQAGIMEVKTLETYDWSFNPQVPKSVILDLASTRFVRLNFYNLSYKKCLFEREIKYGLKSWHHISRQNPHFVPEESPKTPQTVEVECGQASPFGPG